MKPMILGFAGSIASGKSTLSIEVAKTLGWQRVGFGDYVRTVARNHGLGESREALQTVGASLINEGIEQFCKSVLAQVNWEPRLPLVIDGIRHAETISTLRQIVAPLDFRLVFAAVNESIREARLIEREFAASEKWEQIEGHSTEVQVQTVLPQMADLTIDNSRRIEDSVLKIVSWVKQQQEK